MRQQPFLSSAKSSRAPAAGGGGRKPLVRPRVSGSAGSTASCGSPVGSPTPARLSPVLPDIITKSPNEQQDSGVASAQQAGTALAAAAPSCTPPHEAVAVAVPTSNTLVRALLRKTTAPPAIAQPLHPSPLPPLSATAPAVEDESNKTHIAGGCTGEKRERYPLSAGSRSTASSSAAMPTCKRRTADGGAAGDDAGSTIAALIGAAEGMSSRVCSASDGDLRRERLAGPHVLCVEDVERMGQADAGTPDLPSERYVAATIANGAFCTTADQEDQILDREGEDEDAAVAVSPMHRTRVLDDELLRDWTGYEDLDLVLSVELRLDAERMMGVHELGQRLPRLTALRLSRSHIPKVRLLGTRCMHLRHLWINNCQLDDLRGIGAFAPNLTELYASFNSIKDLTPLLDLSSTLEVLDVEGNMIDDVSVVAFVLPSLHKVTCLNISGNGVHFKWGEVERALSAMQADLGITTAAMNGDTHPAATTADTVARGVAAFRQWIQLLMPQLETLDDVPLSAPATPLSPALAASPSALAEDGRGGEEESHGSADAAARPPTKNGTRKIHSTHVYIDPLDDALSAELRLLQDCIRENETFDDRLTESLERKHSSLYSRPSTSCAAGARQRVGSTSRVGSAAGCGSRCGSGVSSSLSSAARHTLASASGGGGGGSAKREAAAAMSDLTTGSVLAGSAITSLRKRLLRQQQQTQLKGGAAGVALLPTTGGGPLKTDTVLSASGSPMEDRTPDTNHALSSEGAEYDDGRPLISDEEDEEERAWYLDKAKANLARRLSDHEKAPIPKYRQLYQQLFPESESVRAAKTHDGPNSGGQGSVKGCGRTADDMDAVVKKEVSRARLQLAAMAAAEADSADEERAAAASGSAWGAEAFSQRATSPAPRICLHQPNVLNFSDE